MFVHYGPFVPRYWPHTHVRTLKRALRIKLQAVSGPMRSLSASGGTLLARALALYLESARGKDSLMMMMVMMVMMMMTMMMMMRRASCPSRALEWFTRFLPKANATACEAVHININLVTSCTGQESCQVTAASSGLQLGPVAEKFSADCHVLNDIFNDILRILGGSDGLSLKSLHRMNWLLVSDAKSWPCQEAPQLLRRPPGQHRTARRPQRQSVGPLHMRRGCTWLY